MQEMKMQAFLLGWKIFASASVYDEPGTLSSFPFSLFLRGSMVASYSQRTNPSITIPNPTVIPAISCPPFADPVVALAPAEPEVGLVSEPLVAVAAALGTCEPVGSKVADWPIVGMGGLPLIAHPLGVADGHAGVEMSLTEALYTDRAAPLGLSVAHCDFRLSKSGDIGTGLPERTMAPPDAVLVPA